MSCHLFIDDERFPGLSTEQFAHNSNLPLFIARSSEAAIELVKEYGIPEYISFDHDLGGDDTSMNFLHWLVNYMLDNKKGLPDNFSYYVHSANPIGRGNIIGMMDNIKRNLVF